MYPVDGGKLPNRGGRAMPGKASAAEPWERRTFLWMVVVMATAVALRVLAYWFDPAMWWDELCLALNVAGRSYGRLLDPLSYLQFAPVGMLMLWKTLETALGPSEYVFRLTSLLAGLATLPLLVMAARRMMSNRGAVIALALLAVSEHLLYETNVFKQYPVDALVSLLVVYLGLGYLQSRRRGRWLGVLLVVGAIGTWFTQPLIFTLAGVGVVLLIDELAPGRRARAGALVRMGAVWVVGVVWMVSFGLQYVLFIRHAYGQASLVQSYGTYLNAWPPMALHHLGDFQWYLDKFFALFKTVGGLYAMTLPAAMFVIGVVALARRDWRVAALVLLPGLFVFLASAARFYPFADRFLYFYAPLLLLVVAAGIDFTFAHAGPRPAVVGGVLVVVILLQPTIRAGLYVARYRGKESIRQSLAYLHEHYRAGDKAYIYRGASQAYRFYSRYYPARFGMSGLEAVIGKEHRLEPEKYAGELRPLRGQLRVWVLICHVQGHDRAAILGVLNRWGRAIETDKGYRTWLYLYDLNRPVASASTQPGPGP